MEKVKSISKIKVLNLFELARIKGGYADADTHATQPGKQPDTPAYEPGKGPATPAR